MTRRKARARPALGKRGAAENATSKATFGPRWGTQASCHNAPPFDFHPATGLAVLAKGHAALRGNRGLAIVGIGTPPGSGAHAPLPVPAKPCNMGAGPGV